MTSQNNNQAFMDFFHSSDDEKTAEKESKKDESEKPSVGLFDFLKDITARKKGDLLDSSTEKEFSKFMILRFLACDPELVERVELVEPYQDVLSKRQLYELLLVLIPQKKRYLKYRIKKGSQPSDEVVEKLATEFEVSKDVAYKYVQIMSDEERVRYLQSFGGELK